MNSKTCDRQSGKKIAFCWRSLRSLLGGAGAALMLAGTALLAMFFVLSYPGLTSPAQVSTAASVPLTVPPMPTGSLRPPSADGHGCTAIRADGRG